MRLFATARRAAAHSHPVKHHEGPEMILTGWSALTRMPDKARLYEHDTHFRESLSEAQEAFGPRISEILWRSALMIVTPDGLATAQLGVICEYLAGHGFSIVALEPLQ